MSIVIDSSNCAVAFRQRIQIGKTRSMVRKVEDREKADDTGDSVRISWRCGGTSGTSGDGGGAENWNVPEDRNWERRDVASQVRRL